MIGTSADMMINIWGAMIVGGLAGAGSIFIDRFSTVGSNYNDTVDFILHSMLQFLCVNSLKDESCSPHNRNPPRMVYKSF